MTWWISTGAAASPAPAVGAHVRDDVAREAEDALRRFAHAPDPLGVGRIGAVAAVDRVLQEEIGVRDDRGERVVELVNEPRGELAERRELLRLDDAVGHLAERALRVVGRRVNAGVLERARQPLGRAACDVERRRSRIVERRVVARDVERRPRRDARDVEDVLVREAGEEARRIGAPHARRLDDGDAREDALLPRGAGHVTDANRVRGQKARDGVDEGAHDRLFARRERELAERDEEPIDQRRRNGRQRRGAARGRRLLRDRDRRVADPLGGNARLEARPAHGGFATFGHERSRFSDAAGASLAGPDAGSPLALSRSRMRARPT